MPHFNGPKTSTTKIRQTSTALKAQTPSDVPKSFKDSKKPEQPDAEIVNASSGNKKCCSGANVINLLRL